MKGPLTMRECDLPWSGIEPGALISLTPKGGEPTGDRFVVTSIKPSATREWVDVYFEPAAPGFDANGAPV